ncbi:hypothetical protein F7725_023597 [Dissostichus mawsoni]|uniref:Neurotransmitter-gated ion-channel ligand-binding domain-containing protein n=1 Tax=Dissostichus mawsoni TaxID=36200 RepID=A0A7J5XWZ6_DISMA|nr:hypothetical protein F7725_023597 [Dissostichus mawsoni]
MNLTRNKELYSTVRPARDYKLPTLVYVSLLIRSILDMSEVDQTFVSVIRIYMKWEDPHIHWNPEDFGGLDKMRVPADLLWKPDLMIKEMIEKYKAVPNPFITIHSKRYVEHVRELLVVSTCKMHVHKFPSDNQHCYVSHVYRLPRSGLGGVFPSSSSNFLVPIMILFCLDLASFLMSDKGGEKVSFKVTLLLAVTVMQLILNDVLPSSSDEVPIIAIFCFGTFGLMFISLLETILVKYLIEKDSASEESNADKGLSKDCGDKQGNYDGVTEHIL